MRNKNLRNYLSNFRLLTDAVNIKNGFIINIGLDFSIIPLPGYQGKEVLLRDINESIDFPVWYRGNSKGHKVPVHEYLRTYLQAALDNAEYGLLGEWNYSQANLYQNLFKYKAVEKFME